MWEIRSSECSQGWVSRLRQPVGQVPDLSGNVTSAVQACCANQGTHEFCTDGHKGVQPSHLVFWFPLRPLVPSLSLVRSLSGGSRLVPWIPPCPLGARWHDQKMTHLASGEITHLSGLAR